MKHSIPDKVFKYRDYKIKIYQDTNPRSPDDIEDDNCFLVYEHRQFNVEVHGFDPKEIFNHLVAKSRLNDLTIIQEKQNLNDEEREELADTLNEDINDTFNDYYIWVVYAY